MLRRLEKKKKKSAIAKQNRDKLKALEPSRAISGEAQSSFVTKAGDQLSNDDDSQSGKQIWKWTLSRWEGAASETVKDCWSGIPMCGHELMQCVKVKMSWRKPINPSRAIEAT